MNRIKTYIRSSLHKQYSPEEIKNLTVMICRDLLGFSLPDIYVGKDTKLSDNQEKQLKTIVGRLMNNEPIQYICGCSEFYGISFHVSPGVLVPRPETEELVEMIIKENPSASKILDIGTGSGCIAISLSRHLPNAKVWGWDISEDALAVARKNNEHLKTNVTFRQQNVLDEIAGNDTFDVIVSNPPYITEREKAEMDKNVLDWEPAEALFVPDNDPLLFYRRIAALGMERLNPDGGRLYFEINRAYGKETAGLLENFGYHDVYIIKDLSGNDRIVKAKR